jgi:cytochrome c551/c552
MRLLAQQRIGHMVLWLLILSSNAQAGGVASSGEALARRVCAECHIVANDQAKANVDVPSFMSIAKKYQGKSDALRAFLIEPHQPMPDLSLKRQQILDLMAYIESL